LGGEANPAIGKILGKYSTTDIPAWAELVNGCETQVVKTIKTVTVPQDTMEQGVCYLLILRLGQRSETKELPLGIPQQPQD
jgi:hypothetical protein